MAGALDVHGHACATHHECQLGDCEHHPPFAVGGRDVEYVFEESPGCVQRHQQGYDCDEVTRQRDPRRSLFTFTGSGVVVRLASRGGFTVHGMLTWVADDAGGVPVWSGTLFRGGCAAHRVDRPRGSGVVNLGHHHDLNRHGRWGCFQDHLRLVVSCGRWATLAFDKCIVQ